MKIYRYRRLSVNTYHELIHGEIWYSKYTELNDPFEGLYIDKSNKGSFDFLVNELRVCCFSKSNESLLMWAHYADSHKGICLEYEVDEYDYKSMFFDVNYNQTLPTFEKIRTYPPGHPSEGALHISINNEGRIFNTKSTDWAYEKEVRTLKFSKNSNSKGEWHKPPIKLTSIYFGLRASDDSMRRINKIMPHKENIIFYKTSLLNNEYQISMHKLNRQEI